MSSIVRDGYLIGIDYAIDMTKHAIKYNKDLAWLLVTLGENKAKNELENK